MWSADIRHFSQDFHDIGLLKDVNSLLSFHWPLVEEMIHQSIRVSVEAAKPPAKVSLRGKPRRRYYFLREDGDGEHRQQAESSPEWLYKRKYNVYKL